jgi:hypothetical protein
VRLAIVHALEALEAGDTRLAVAVLLGALEESDQTAKRHACPRCGVPFAWPGKVADHLRVVHDWAVAA